jgi:hypothetical protein
MLDLRPRHVVEYGSVVATEYIRDATTEETAMPPIVSLTISSRTREME